MIISTILIQFYGWTGFDPIASLFIAILIAASVTPLVIDCGRVLCLDVGDKADSVKDALSDVSIHDFSVYFDQILIRFFNSLTLWKDSQNTLHQDSGRKMPQA